MTVEVPCPQCGSVLRAPEGSAGKKARCKKCQHGFRLPGAAIDEAGQQSTQLSAIETPAFSFDGSTPAAAVPAKASRSKYKSSTATPRTSPGRGPARRRGGPLLAIFGAAALLIAGGIGYSVSTDSPKTETAATVTPKVKPAEPVKEPAEKTTLKKSGAAALPELAAKAPVKKAVRAAVVSGGMKLPAAPAKAELFTKPVTKARVDLEFAKVRRVFVSGGESPVAAVVSAADAGFQGAGAKDFVDRYNLASGERIDRTEIQVDTAGFRAGDLSPNGELFIAEGPAGTLTLYDLNAKIKIGTPFKPFAGSPEVPTPLLAAAHFADDRTVLVVAKDGRVESWKVSEGEKLGAGSLGGAVAARACTMKPDRSAMLVVVGESVFEVPVKSLTPRAVLSLPHGGGEGLAISIDSADRLAVAYLAVQPGPHTRVIVARLGDPKPSTDLHIDESVGVIESLDWCGPDAFALSFDKLGVGVVYETEVNKPMATLWPHGGVARHAVAGGKHYVLMIDDKKCVLLGLDFPPDDYLPLRNEAVQAKAPIGFLLTPEGIGR